MIPNSDYITLAGVDPEEVRVILYGVPRSGSIWAWQILCDLAPEGGVIHTHEYLIMWPTIPVICTIRDWRDCLASNWRVDRPIGLHHCTHERLFWYAAQCHRFAFILQQYLARRNALLLRYEAAMSNQPGAVQQMSSRLGKRISKTRATEICGRHSMQRNRELQKESPERGFSPTTLLHSRHVGTGRSGTWRDWVAERDWPLLHELLGPLLEEWGYAA